MGVWNVRNVDTFARDAATSFADRYNLTCAEFITGAVYGSISGTTSFSGLFSDYSIYNQKLNLVNMPFRTLKILTRNISGRSTKVLVIGKFDQTIYDSLERALGMCDIEFWDYPAHLSTLHLPGEAYETNSVDLFRKKYSESFRLILVCCPLNMLFRDHRKNYFFELAAELLQSGGRIILAYWKPEPSSDANFLSSRLQDLRRDLQECEHSAQKAGVPIICSIMSEICRDRIKYVRSNDSMYETFRSLFPKEVARRITLQTLVEQFLLKSGQITGKYAVFYKPDTEDAWAYLEQRQPLTRIDALLVSGFIDRRFQAAQLLPRSNFDQLSFRRRQFYRGPIEIDSNANPWAGWSGFAVEKAFEKCGLVAEGKNCLIVGRPDRLKSTADFLVSARSSTVWEYSLTTQPNYSRAEPAQLPRLLRIDHHFFDSIGPGPNARTFDVIVIDTGTDWLSYFLQKTIRIVKSRGHILLFIRKPDRAKWIERRGTPAPDIQETLVGLRHWFDSVEGAELTHIQKIRSDSGNPEYLAIASIDL